MAVVRIPDEERVIAEFAEARAYLGSLGIEYEQWQTDLALDRGASQEQILAAYSSDIDRLKARGGYTSADVIDVSPNTVGLDAMLAKFSIEHWHDEDEVRYILDGRGIFHIHPPNGPVIVIEVGAGDLIRVPRGTYHWFDLCGERQIRAIRLFQNASGWTPRYTNSGVDRKYEPLCLGPAYIPFESATK